MDKLYYGLKAVEWIAKSYDAWKNQAEPPRQESELEKIIDDKPHPPLPIEEIHKIYWIDNLRVYAPCPRPPHGTS